MNLSKRFLRLSACYRHKNIQNADIMPINYRANTFFIEQFYSKSLIYQHFIGIIINIENADIRKILCQQISTRFIPLPHP